jgi:LEA14-like dessication related protein
MSIRKQNIFLLFIVLFTSCGNFSKITVGEIKDFTVNGFEDNALLASVSIPVDNPTHHNITITDIDLKVYMNNQYLGKVNAIEPIVLLSKSNRNYNIDLKVRVANFFGAALTLMNLQNGQIILFRMEGTVSARSMLLKKKFEISEERKVVI